MSATSAVHVMTKNSGNTFHSQQNPKRHFDSTTPPRYLSSHPCPNHLRGLWLVRFRGVGGDITSGWQRA